LFGKANNFSIDSFAKANNFSVSVFAKANNVSSRFAQVARMFAGIFWFLVVTGLLVSWHEYGHFWVGKRCGVKILRYAYGFGPALYKRTGKDGIEYAINAIPLGGYVKFADTRDGSCEPADEYRAFDKVSLSKRTAIVLAGPLANLVFAVVAFSAVYMVGVSDFRPVVGEATGLAKTAGLVRGDEILRVNETDVRDWGRVGIELVQAGYAKETAQLQVRNALTPNAAARTVSLDLSQLPDKFDESVFGTLGLAAYMHSADLNILEFAPNGPAQRAGLRTGEKITAVNGVPVARQDQFIARIQALGKSNAGKVVLTVVRGGVPTELAVQAQQSTLSGVTAWRVGIVFDRLTTTARKGVFDAIGAGFKDTWFFTTRTLVMIKNLLIGNASVKNVSGPITIGQIASESAQAGLAEFLRLLAGISLSLFIVNLLPVPVLDGGQLLFFAMEKLKGAPLGERAMEFGAAIGVLVLFGLMTLAITNDLTRVFGH
jgi:regulator of sigma E protease